MTIATPSKSKHKSPKPRRQPKPYTNSLLAGLLLGAVLFFAYFISGDGLGASGAENRIAIWLAKLIAPGWVNSTPAYIKYGGGIKQPLDHAIVMIGLGVILGGFLSSYFQGRFQRGTTRGPHVSPKLRWTLAFLGGIFAGFGARLARGCTSGQGLNGAATLSVGSWAFLLAFFAGGYALAYFVRKLWN
ncbi:MAG: YeeE/YedE family protein [Chloroflexi bacterium]|nr:YeeE/YedE family protein [Chloroflexota bacterium]